MTYQSSDNLRVGIEKLVSDLARVCCCEYKARYELLLLPTEVMDRSEL